MARRGSGDLWKCRSTKICEFAAYNLRAKTKEADDVALSCRYDNATPDSPTGPSSVDDNFVSSKRAIVGYLCTPRSNTPSSRPPLASRVNRLAVLATV